MKNLTYDGVIAAAGDVCVTSITPDRSAPTMRVDP